MKIKRQILKNEIKVYQSKKVIPVKLIQNKVLRKVNSLEASNKLVNTNRFKALRSIIQKELKGKSEQEVRSTFGVSRYEK